MNCRKVFCRKKIKKETMQQQILSIPKTQILSLYRKLLKKGNEQLVYTSKEFYRKRLRMEFQTVATKVDPKVRAKMFQKGEELLRTNLGGLM